MITETQTCIIVLQLTDELATQLLPFIAGLDITTRTVEHAMPNLTMSGDVYAMLAEHLRQKHIVTRQAISLQI